MADVIDPDVVNLEGPEEVNWLHRVRRQNPEQYPNVDLEAIYGTPENPKTPSEDELESILDSDSEE
jgi:hypothetical protein